jgi:DNA primase
MTLALAASPSRVPIDLPDLCAKAGIVLRRQGKSYGSRKCLECGEGGATSNKFSVYVGRDGRWRYKCQHCGIYGDSADFLALAQNLTLAEALRELTGGATSREWVQRVRQPAAATIAPSNTSQEALRRVIAKLKAHAFDNGPRAYLKKRCITDATIDRALESGQLRMLPTDPKHARDFLEGIIGKEDLIAAGLLKSDKGWPAMAFRPIIALESGGTGIEIRAASEEYEGPKAIRYGTMSWPWYFKRTARPRSVMVVEGFIDALSVLQGFPEAEAVLGVPGVNGWTPRWFQALKESDPTIQVLIGVDNDAAGLYGSEKLDTFLKGLELSRMVVTPPQGKDWNEALVAQHSFF